MKLFILWAAQDNAKVEHCKCRALGYLLEDDTWMASFWHNLAQVYRQSAVDWLKASRHGSIPKDPFFRCWSLIPTQYN